MSLQDFPQRTQVLLYEGDKPTKYNLWYQGTLDSIPNSNTEKYFGVQMQVDNGAIIYTRGHYLNEVFNIPIIVTPLEN